MNLRSFGLYRLYTALGVLFGNFHRQMQHQKLPEPSKRRTTGFHIDTFFCIKCSNAKAANEKFLH